MFCLSKYSNILANRLIILNVSKARSAKIKEIDLVPLQAGLRDSNSFNFYASLRQERLQNYQNC